MTSMTRTTVGVTGGVDMHGQSHHAAVIDHLGRQLGDREFPASPGVIAPSWSGCKAPASWIESVLSTGAATWQLRSVIVPASPAALAGVRSTSVASSLCAGRRLDFSKPMNRWQPISVPVVECKATARTRNRCKNKAIPGRTVCRFPEGRARTLLQTPLSELRSSARVCRSRRAHRTDSRTARPVDGGVVQAALREANFLPEQVSAFEAALAQ